MQQPSNADVVKDLYGDLARKYTVHGPNVEEYWRSFSREQRIRCVKAGAKNGDVLKDPTDHALGNVYKLIPEWNLRDLTEPGSDHFLNLLRHRSLKDPYEQYHSGPKDGPGDLEFIEEMMRTENLRMTVTYENCWSFFAGMEEYGKSYKVLYPSALADIDSYIGTGAVIPQETGELVLMRQQHLLQIFNIIVEDILDEGSTARDSKPRPKNSENATAEAFSKLQIRNAPVPLSLPDLIAYARDQKASLEDYLELLSSEPVVLAHDVNHWFFSRPELVPDEKGRTLPQHTDKYISGSVLDAVHSAVKGAALWAYIDRLLERFGDIGADKVYRNIILQELSNICHFEFSRTQSLLKRHVAKTSKLFKRMSNAYDASKRRTSYCHLLLLRLFADFPT
ncbi:hypothetical protein ColLi_12332 [Colletotrichum liriopes]|uniref:Uncharacterized protein n=1 Tax=Colletotrichum liriopes TaxID=708192 RepID=A0AA37GZ29_9PEZI|nr:hypothetical protein ColLi_12332 [Colletotrichum liriopes]